MLIILILFIINGNVLNNGYLLHTFSAQFYTARVLNDHKVMIALLLMVHIIMKLFVSVMNTLY